MPVPANPHDSLFRALMEDPQRADTLVRTCLPETIRGLLSDQPLRLADGTFIDEALRGSQSDRLYEARLATGGTALVYVLVEHKSHPDPGTPLQVLSYMVRIWQRHAGRETERLRALPPIVPLVFHHGDTPWSEPLSVLDMVEAEGPLADFVRSLSYVVYDLGEREPDTWSGDRAVDAVLWVLRHVFERKLTPQRMREIMAGLPAGDRLEIQTLRYILSTYPIPLERVEAAVREARPETWEAVMATVAETWLKEGEARGFSKGRAEGKAETLLRQLERRFGDVPGPARSRVRAASPATLDGWLDAVLDADSLDAVFGGTPTH